MSSLLSSCGARRVTIIIIIMLPVGRRQKARKEGRESTGIIINKSLVVNSLLTTYSPFFACLFVCLSAVVEFEAPDGDSEVFESRKRTRNIIFTSNKYHSFFYSCLSNS